jgi:biopolymer transport protein ExbD
MTIRKRRLRKEAAHLEITAFINLIVVLVPFLLSTAVFTRLAVMDLKLPAAAAQGAIEQLKLNDLQLEVVLRRDALEVGDRIGGLIQRIERKGDGQDIKALAALMVQVKGKFPEKAEASLLADPEIPYDDMVQVMDAMRATFTAQGTAKLMRAQLFPNISIGDAPVRGGAAMAAAAASAAAAAATPAVSAPPAAAPAAVQKGKT